MCPKRLIAHINHVVLAKGHPRRHLNHKFWARKPHNVVEEYIKHYSKKGEIVLDPFVGSGITAVEALVLERKAIAIDLNPIAAFITEMVAKPADIEGIKEAYEKIKHRSIEMKVKSRSDDPKIFIGEVYKSIKGGK